MTIDDLKAALAAAEQRATTAEQKLKHGYFGDTYESLLASWREQDQALQDIYGACGTEENVGCPGDVARIAIEALTSSEGLRQQLEQDAAQHLERANQEIARRERVEIAYTQSEQKRLQLIDRAEKAEAQLKASEGLRERLQSYVQHKPECEITKKARGPATCGFSTPRGGFHWYCWGEFGHSGPHYCGPDRLEVANDRPSPCTCGLADLLAAIPVSSQEKHA